MVILGLGSNIGDRLSYLKQAVRHLQAFMQNMRFSPVLESAALLPEGAPEVWNQPYLNMVLTGDTELTPLELLNRIKSIESDMGRDSDCVWGPRQIDIDILAVDNTVLDSAELKLPHREMLNRDFVLLPLAHVAPEWRYPAVGGIYCSKSASEIAAMKGFALGNDLRDSGLKIDG